MIILSKPPAFEDIDINRDGRADFGEITGWVLGRQSTEDVECLRSKLCLPEHENKNDEWESYHISSNYELNDQQKKRLHAIIDNYCFPMGYRKYNDGVSIFNGHAYPTVRIETISNQNANYIYANEFQYHMIDQQQNEILDIRDVIFHFIFANKGYDFSGEEYEFDVQSENTENQSGFGYFNNIQWIKLFNCLP